MKARRIDLAVTSFGGRRLIDGGGDGAAAATAVVAETGGCLGPDPARTITFPVDHPFLFAIRYARTGATLFMGRVLDPSQRRGATRGGRLAHLIGHGRLAVAGGCIAWSQKAGCQRERTSHAFQAASSLPAVTCSP